ncbi:MAG: hypothetical protein JWQ63_3382 [Mucilaginibacter sp.]|jgi:hypothetical protein|nr:hypothetical protein [Mucilaginibacter sp.]
MKRITTHSFLIVCFVISLTTTGNLNGKWTGVLKTDQGREYPLFYNFKIDGDQLTGTAKTPKGDMPITNGKINGDDFVFSVIIGKMEIDHIGKFYGDSVGVDISLGEAKSHTTLKREQ